MKEINLEAQNNQNILKHKEQEKLQVPVNQQNGPVEQNVLVGGEKKEEKNDLKQEFLLKLDTINEVMPGKLTHRNSKKQTANVIKLPEKFRETLLFVSSWSNTSVLSSTPVKEAAKRLSMSADDETAAEALQQLIISSVKYLAEKDRQWHWWFGDGNKRRRAVRSLLNEAYAFAASAPEEYRDKITDSEAALSDINGVMSEAYNRKLSEPKRLYSELSHGGIRQVSASDESVRERMKKEQSLLGEGEGADILLNRQALERLSSKNTRSTYEDRFKGTYDDKVPGSKEFSKLVRKIKNPDLSGFHIRSRADIISYAADNIKEIDSFKKDFRSFDLGFASDLPISEADLRKVTKTRKLIDLIENYQDLILCHTANKYYGKDIKEEPVGDPEWLEYKRLSEELSKDPVGKADGNMEALKEAAEDELKKCVDSDYEKLNSFYAMGHYKKLEDEHTLAYKIYSKNGEIEKFKNSQDPKIVESMKNIMASKNPNKDMLVARRIAMNYSTAGDTKCLCFDEKIKEEELEDRWVRLMKRRVKGRLINEAKDAVDIKKDDTKNALKYHMEEKNYMEIGRIVKGIIDVDLDTVGEELLQKPGLYLPKLAQFGLLSEYMDEIVKHAKDCGLSPDELADAKTAISMAEEIQKRYEPELKFYRSGDVYLDEKDMLDNGFFRAFSGYVNLLYKNKKLETDEKERIDYFDNNKSSFNNQDEARKKRSIYTAYVRIREDVEDEIVRSNMKWGMGDVLSHCQRKDGSKGFYKADFIMALSFYKKDLDNYMGNIRAYKKEARSREKNSGRERLMNLQLSKLKERQTAVLGQSYTDAVMEHFLLKDKELNTALQEKSALFLRSKRNKDNSIYTGEEEFIKDREEVSNLLLEEKDVLKEQVNILSEVEDAELERERLNDLAENRQKQYDYIQNLDYASYMKMVTVYGVTSWYDICDISEETKKKREKKDEKLKTLSDYFFKNQNELERSRIRDVKKCDEENKKYDQSYGQVYRGRQKLLAIRERLNNLLKMKDEDLDLLDRENESDISKMLGLSTTTREYFMDIFRDSYSNVSIESFKRAKTLGDFEGTSADSMLHLGAEEMAPMLEFVERLMDDEAFGESVNANEAVKAKIKELQPAYFEIIRIKAATHDFVKLIPEQLGLSAGEGQLSDTKDLVINNINRNFKKASVTFGADMASLATVYTRELVNKLFPVLIENGVRIPIDKEGKGNTKEYLPEVDKLADYADTTDTTEIQISGKTFRINKSFKLPEGAALQNPDEAEELQRLFDEENIIASKITVYDKALYEKVLPDISKEDEKTVEALKKISETGFQAFFALMKINTYNLKQKDITGRINALLGK